MGVDVSHVRRPDDEGPGPGVREGRASGFVQSGLPQSGLPQSGSPQSGLPTSGQGPWWLRDPVLRLPELRADRQILVVAAPPGSGRARLVRCWLERSGHVPRTWVRLATGPQPPQEAAELAVRRQVESGRGGFVVLEGVERLTRADLESLLTGLPPGPRLVLLGCGEVLSPALAVRVAGRIAEVRADDLWWPVEVVAAQVTASIGGSVDPATAQRIHRSSGGWPAGVLALARAARGAASASAGEVLADLTADLVLSRIPRQLRDFVLATAVLPECAADPRLHAALVPGADPAAMAEQVRRWGLGADGWPAQDAATCGCTGARIGCRPFYHPFVVAAARRIQGRSTETAGAGLIRAARIAAELGRGQLALDCLLAAGAWEQALDELEHAAAQGFCGWSGERLQRVLQSLPRRSWADHARRRATVALAAAVCGDHLLAGEAVASAPSAVAAEPWWVELGRLVDAFAGRTIRPGGPGCAPDPARGELGGSPERIGGAGRTGPPPELFGLRDGAALTAAIHVLAARTAGFAGDRQSVTEHLDAARADPGIVLPRYLLLAALGADALVSAWSGELNAAVGLVDRARRLAEQAGLAGHPLLAAAVLAEAEVLRSRAQAAAALQVLDRGGAALHAGQDLVVGLAGGPVQVQAHRVLRARLLLDLADAGDPEVTPGDDTSAPAGPVVGAPVTVAPVTVAPVTVAGYSSPAGYLAAAAALLEQVRADGGAHLPPGLGLRAGLARARLAELRGDRVEVQARLAQLPTVAVVSAWRLSLALHRQDEDAAAMVLAVWPPDATTEDRLCRLLAEAAVALAGGRRQQAGELIGEALQAAESDGHVRVFLDAAPAVRAMLCSLVRGVGLPTDLTRTLAARLVEVGAAGDGSVGVTRRELVVLEQLTTERTHAQIAATLFVSENTLKSHCRNLYRKLGVHSREDAVRIARIRGWLRPELSDGKRILDVDASGVSNVVDV